jgi:polyphosphate kinase 2 (PPK2 family)
VVKVHPELLDKAQLPPGPRGRSFWRSRYDDINHFEHHMHRNGTLILKFFLNVSKREQKKRFMERLDNPDKHWKFSMADLAERAFWKQYMRAYEDMMTATSTKWAPWHIIPADHKWVTRAMVSAIITHSIRKLDLNYPKISAAQRAALAAARRKLLRE